MSGFVGPTGAPGVGLMRGFVGGTNFYQGAANEMPGTTAGFTVCVGVRLEANPPANRTLIQCGTAAGGWALECLSAPRFAFACHNHGGVNGGIIATERPPRVGVDYLIHGQWTGVGGNQVVYVNGFLDATRTTAEGANFTAPPAGSQPTLGGAGPVLGPLLSGEGWIWGMGYIASVLTQDQIYQHLYACSTAGALVAGGIAWQRLYPGLGAADTIVDVMGSGQVLTRVGAVTVQSQGIRWW